MSLEQRRSFSQIRGLVAKALLEHAGDGTNERRQLTQRDIALSIGTDWETVHASLESLYKEGTIRIERHRIIIYKELLQKVTGVQVCKK